MHHRSIALLLLFLPQSAFDMWRQLYNRSIRLVERQASTRPAVSQLKDLKIRRSTFHNFLSFSNHGIWGSRIGKGSIGQAILWHGQWSSVEDPRWWKRKKNEYWFRRQWNAIRLLALFDVSRRNVSNESLSIGVSERHKTLRPTIFLALKLRNVLSGEGLPGKIFRT